MMEWDCPPVSVDRVWDDAPPVVKVDVPGATTWLMTPEYARAMAALLRGAALAVEELS